MSYYGNRYASMYQPDFSFMRPNQQGDLDALGQAQGWKTAGAVMPMIGSALGTVDGAVGDLALGAATGGASTAASAGLGAAQGAVGAATGGKGPGIPTSLAGLGGQVGGSLGQAVGAPLTAYGDSLLDPMRYRELQKQALMSLLRGAT